jgi:hypothetical protein
MLHKLRILVGVSVLTVSVAVLWQRHWVYAEEPMRINDLPKSGLKLLSYRDGHFEKLLKMSLANDSTPELELLKPYTVILQNNSNKILVAYALRWEYTNEKGQRVHIDYSDSQISRLMDGSFRRPTTEFDKSGPTLEPYSWLIIAPSTSLKTSSGARERADDPDYQRLLQKLSKRLGEALDVSVTLDGAIFEDGSFNGPNASHLLEHFVAELRAKQNLTENIVKAVQQGKTLSEVARDIQVSVSGSRPKLSTASDGTINGYNEYYSFLYASKFLTVYRNSGEESALAWAESNRFQYPPKIVNLNELDAKP